MHTFDTPGKTRVIIYNPIDAIDVTAGQVATTTVELVPRGADSAALVDATSVTCTDATGTSVVTVTLPGPRSFSRRRNGLGVRIVAPEGADLVIATDGSERSLFSISRGLSGDVRLHGTFGDVEVALVSGDVTAETVAGTLAVKTTSGDLTAGRVGGRLNVRTVSGDVEVGEISGDASVTVVSGDVTITTAEGTLDVTSVSGDVEVGDARLGSSCKSTSGDVTVRRAWAGSVRAATVSGDVVIGVPSGRGVEVEARSMSGDLSSEIDLRSDPDDLPTPSSDGTVVRISAHSVSGDISIRRAAAASV